MFTIRSGLVRRGGYRWGSGEGGLPSPCYAVVSLAASFTSTGTEGPIVVVRYSVFRYWPLAADGLLRTRASTSDARFCSSAAGSKEALPIATWMIPALSVRNSTRPPLTSRTARPTSKVTVPDLGLGIRPRGPRMRPSGPTLLIMSGVAMATSKSVQPCWMRCTRSSPPMKSAPASCASRALSPPTKASTRTILPVPAGSDTVPRTIWSACRTSTPRRTCASTVASNLTVDVSLTTSQALTGVRPASPLTPSASSTFLRASEYLLPCLFLANDFEPHRTGRALDHLHRGRDVERVEVLGLGLRDRPDLLAGDRAGLLAARLDRALLDAGGLLQHVHRRGRSEHEREAPVLVDGDLGRHDVAGLLSGPLVVGAAELHDVDAVRAQGRAHGR